MSANTGGPRQNPGVFGIDDRFCFDCHRGLSCFGQCCRDINIFLTPYDVIRLKKRMGISSTEFLRDYTEELNLPGMAFPVIFLKMKEDDLKCPFVTEKGCSVYEERPWSCRMAPVDMAGPGTYRMAFDGEKCLGLNGGKEWTVREWMGAQDMEIYERVESGFKDIPARVRLSGRESRDKKIAGIFKIVCYDIDAFREFARKNVPLMGQGGIGRAMLKRALEDDVRLLDAAIGWFINVVGREGLLIRAENLLRRA
ncbi:MAG: YkgJ family cysteine cluster protein [Bacillota bacterium]